MKKSSFFVLACFMCLGIGVTPRYASGNQSRFFLIRDEALIGDHASLSLLKK